MEELTFRLENVVKARQEVMEDFEGPLDLILDLLRRNKIEIQDLRISLLLEQYLRWMELRRNFDLEVASEFIAMASHLVYLKTKMLLSVGDSGDEEVDELILALEERQRQDKLFRVTVGREFLESRAELARSVYCKGPESIERDKTYQYRHSADDLLSALGAIYERTERRAPPPPEVFRAIAGREPYPVGDKVNQILGRLAAKGKTLLKSILAKASSKSEAVAAFLAVLELCRSHLVRIDDFAGDYVVDLVEGDAEQ